MTSFGVDLILGRVVENNVTWTDCYYIAIETRDQKIMKVFRVGSN